MVYEFEYLCCGYKVRIDTGGGLDQIGIHTIATLDDMSDWADIEHAEICVDCPGVRV
jgi:hypothetical protein